MPSKDWLSRNWQVCGSESRECQTGLCSLRNSAILTAVAARITHIQTEKETIMAKGNNSQKNDKKNKKPKQDKKGKEVKK